MCRRCVVCGNYLNDNDCESYHYPKTKAEALIWQRSMGALETCVDTIQEQCCVCIEHIPQFVELAQKQAALMTAKSAHQMNRPSLNVLLLSGATLPPYCAKSDRSEVRDSKGEATDNLDEDIIVKEFNVNDCGAHFPDIDETEVTVLRTPLQNDEELKNLQNSKRNTEQCGDSENMTDCTDVLLLSRNQNCSSDTSCPSLSRSCPSSSEPNYNISPTLVGCECEQKDEIIQLQQNRIHELEFQLCNQSDWQFSMLQKLNELYSEFGRLEPPNGEGSCSSRPLTDDQQRELMRREESFETTEGTNKLSHNNIKQS